jgi:hypothetical protein
MKIIAAIILSPIVFIGGAYLYFTSDYVESKRLHTQIEKNFGISLKAKPELLEYINYGWAEEGGDKALLILAINDCEAIASIMKKENMHMTGSNWNEMFQANSIETKSVITWGTVTPKNSSLFYALSQSNCVLYRHYHYE